MQQIKSIKNWNNLHAFVLLFGGILMIYTNSVIPILIGGTASFLYYIFTQRHFLSHYKPWGGYANLVTFFRLGLLIGICYMHESINDWGLAFSLISVVLLDVVDGYVARKYNLQSDFGLYFDMETDSFYVAVVSSILYLKGMAPSWILFIGFLRYINVAVYTIFRLKPKKEPKQRFASIIAGTLFTILAAAFVLPPKIRLIALSIISVLLVISFGKSALYYITNDE